MARRQTGQQSLHGRGETAAFLPGTLAVLLLTLYTPGMPHVLDLGAIVGAVVGGVVVMSVYRWRRRRAQRR
ncbi:hypothetical protein KQH42_17305 [Streptomyces sp. CHA1]|nr:Hypothetical protein B591_17654 [Streptomyces sp. GBA 94-10 4N24]ESQ04086.1 Hypothetical protein B590_17649 [Streptomyces sp. PVA_94-07]MBT3158926.1 hypothetical protein [Streptomyces sp. G11C]MCO6702139.1 hypothetical protein [Streptomyces sp. CHB9.2]MCO6708491.1 hypothetical protein [Streptomyces sp. CHA3]MCO6714030.1 hypothetical protein [Streptomyces sp. CHB19.2]MCO6720652.1 hypothetical protein [Streptomyces sp. Vc714c-19]MCO6726177.1 hypothetical protein [Streptomyces sp. CHA16]MCO